MASIPRFKNCSTCGENKPLSEFHKRASSPDGHMNFCKRCRKTEGARAKAVLEDLGLRRCTKCLQAKPFAAFWRNTYSNKLGLDGICKSCKMSQKWKTKLELAERGLKTCSMCKEVKPADQFHPDKRKLFGVSCRCADCGRRATAKWRQSNIEKTRKAARDYWKEHPDKARALERKRRARKSNAPGTFTADEFRVLCEQYGNRCLRCHRDDAPLTADHVIPLTWSGSTNDISNIQPLCFSCNASKGDRHATDYRKEAT